MKHLRVILAILIALAVTGVGAPSASAVEPITGRIVHQISPGYIEDGTWIDATYAPLPGVTVSAHLPTRSGGPATKSLVTVVTSEDGTFSLPVETGPVCVQVAPPAGWQSMWHYGDWPHPQDRTCGIAPATALGDVPLINDWATGRVVDSQTGVPIRGATVHYTPYDFTGRTWASITDAQGYYRVTALDYEEFEVTVSARKYQAGWVSVTGDLVATFGEACNHGVGAIDTPDSLIRMTLR